MRYWNRDRNHAKGLLVCSVKYMTSLLTKSVLTPTEEVHIIKAMEEIGLALSGWNSRHETSKARWNRRAIARKDMYTVTTKEQQ